MDIAVVILNWNGKKLLEQFLPSVVEFSKEATVYMADNASTDESIAFVKREFPTVKIIQNECNGGYAKGYNDALKELSESIFVLLNNDVEVTKNWLPPMLLAFKNDDALVAAQPKILDYNNTDYFEYAGAAGGYIDSLGYPYCRGRIFDVLEKDNGQYDDTKTIFWATGACLLVRRDAFIEIGGFDEDFFAHQEEIDLCWRLNSRGGVIKYIGTSKVFHAGGSTLTSSNPKKTFYNFRNSLLLLVKNNKRLNIWWLLFMRLLLDGVAAIHFLTLGKFSHFISILQAHISFYRLLPRFVKKRKTWASPLKYFSVKSIIWSFYILKRRNFKQD
jgi:GT2 family glycosyltransferase